MSTRLVIYRLTRNRPNGTIQTFDFSRLGEAGDAVFHSLLDNGYVKDRKEAAILAFQAERNGLVDVDGHWYRIERVQP